jgi:hypothetical protein
MACGAGTYQTGYDAAGNPICAPLSGTGTYDPAVQAAQLAAFNTPGYANPLGEELPLSIVETLPGCNIGPGGPGLNQCPMAADGTCTDQYGNPGQSCALIRECDPCTGFQHVQYLTPGGVAPNPNSWYQKADGTWVWLNASGQPGPAPQGASPPFLDKGQFTSNVNPNTTASIAKAANAAGLQYDPSAGWVPIAGSAPTETSPTIPAFTRPAAAAPNSQGSTATKNAASGSPGAPGTSGVVKPVVAPPKHNFLMLAIVAGAILLLSRS